MMNSLLKSKTGAWSAFILLLALLVFSFPFLEVWWEFIPYFFAFMMVFCHLVAVNIVRLNRIASSKLDIAAAVFGILTVIGFIVVWILFQIAFG